MTTQQKIERALRVLDAAENVRDIDRHERLKAVALRMAAELGVEVDARASGWGQALSAGLLRLQKRATAPVSDVDPGWIPAGPTQRAPRRRRGIGRLARRLSGQLQGAQQQANRANTARLQRIMGLYAGMGGSRRGQIDRQARIDAAMARQNLISRGLGHTTVISPVIQRIQERAGRLRTDVSERVAGRQAGVLERVQDVGPGSEYLGLEERLGRASRGRLGAFRGMARRRRRR